MNLDCYHFVFQDNKEFGRLVLSQWLRSHGIDMSFEENPKYSAKRDYKIYFGDVSWTEMALGKKIRPDYYPEFLNQYLFRKLGKCSGMVAWPEDTFVKPIDTYKRFDGYILRKGTILSEGGDCVTSDIVKFVDEWRYYIANQQIYGAEWYKGIDDYPKPAPDWDIGFFPPDYVGVVDMGRLETGEFALVEAQHPFGFGIYSKDYLKMAEFVALGWKYMVKMTKNE